MMAALGPHRVFQLADIDGQDLPQKKQPGAEGLVLGVGCDMKPWWPGAR
jgi:hypothetical protein